MSLSQKLWIVVVCGYNAEYNITILLNDARLRTIKLTLDDIDDIF